MSTNAYRKEIPLWVATRVEHSYRFDVHATSMFSCSRQFTEHERGLQMGVKFFILTFDFHTMALHHNKYCIFVVPRMFTFVSCGLFLGSHSIRNLHVECRNI